MLKYNKDEIIESIQGALALRSRINEIVDEICKDYKNICFIGIGGTWASAMQVYVHMKEYSALDIIVENAAEYLTTGNKRIGKGTFVVLSSVSGTTKEMVKAVDKLHECGAVVLGFIDTCDTLLASMCDYTITYKANEQLKFYMVADRIMHNAREIDWYEKLYNELDRYLAKGLAKIEEDADEFAKEFALNHHCDTMHYFIGAGNLWGATYSYAMCYWEEQHWLKTKSISAGEFFHGMFEIIEKDSAVTLYIGEDAQRSLALRVKDFLPKICNNYTIIDMKDYVIEGISEEYRGMISHLIMRSINHRIDIHIEHINQHDMNIRRYYRKIEY